ncbi:hypothetical protein [Nocardioides dilutus]
MSPAMTRRRSLRLVLVATAFGWMAACGSPDAGSSDSESDDTGSGETAESSYVPPQLAFAEATFAQGFDEWSLLQVDEDRDAGVATGVYEDRGDGSRSIYVILSTDFTLETMEDDAPGLLLDGAHDIDGFTCGQSGSYGSTCYGPLVDGYATVAGSYESQEAGVTFTEDEIAGIARGVYAMFAGSAAPAAAEELCDQVPVDELNATFASFLNGGTLTIDEEYSTNNELDGNQCTLLLPDGAFGAEADETGYVGSLYVDTFAYADDRSTTRGVFDEECTVGGSSADEVFDSAAHCTELMNETGGSNTEATVIPDGDGGVVTDGQTAFVLAPAGGDLWFSGGLGGVWGDASFDAALLAIADSLTTG